MRVRWPRVGSCWRCGAFRSHRRAILQGSLNNLRAASEATNLPCLRKDFIVDEFQILEARANAADAILLIVAALEQKVLVALADRAAAFGLDVLCEAHDEHEVQRALDAGCSISSESIPAIYGRLRWT
mgnify:CR=1 FL=1